MKKISLGIDGRVLFRENLRGIGRYLKNILLGAPDDFDVIVYGPKEYEKYFQISLPSNVKIKTFDMRGYRFQAWEQLGLPFFMINNRHNIFFSPANTAPLFQPCKTVVTLHDAHIWISSNSYGVLEWYYKRLLPLAFKKINHVITISKFSEKELLQVFPFLKNRIRVIYHGIDPIFKPNIPFNLKLIPSSISIKKPYLFYVGGDSPKKRPDFAIDLFARIQKKFPDLSLLMLGISAEGKNYFYNKAQEKKIYNITILPSISDELLAMLYSNALAVLYPTLHEGFGFPVLESMACKVPILASKVASIPEISGYNAFLICPNDIKAWEKTLIWIIDNRFDKILTEKLEIAYRWALQFSWSKTVDQTYNLFREIVLNHDSRYLRYNPLL